MPNHLAQESSPYLRQHADNPVDWYPWGEAAFERARRENRPVHLSVGYAACHWCHVMAHESFEDPRIAEFLNANFVNVKVDRQERPDVDELYQRVVQMMGESGGWPLTVFLTPAQEPFFAGTYFPPEERYGRPAFPRLLHGLARAWRERQHEVRANAEQFLRGWRETDEQLFAPAGSVPADLAGEAARAFAEHTDPQYGGLGGAPKFPNVPCLDLMLRVLGRAPGAPHEGVLHAALQTTLDRMAAGGIYDQLGGGFARYSVDERWQVPHFEKMLYDNAQAVKLYADAYRLLGHARYRRVFEECCAYALRELAHPEGAFFASEDADSEGEEGRYYVWTREQIDAVLGPRDGEFAARAYGVLAGGNFEGGRSVLQRAVALDAADEARLVPLRERLLAARGRRVRPGRDENVLAGWNGLMIQGLCAAFEAGGAAGHLQAARAAAQFVARHLVRADGGLARSWRDGVAGGRGFLDDYANMAAALFDLYEAGFARADLDRGLLLADRILDEFWDDGLYYTPRAGATPLVHRPLAPHDSAWPSGLSAATLALLRAHGLSGRPLYLESARALLERYEAASARNFFGFSHLLAAREFDRRGPVSIALAGAQEPLRGLAAAARQVYLPNRVLGLARDMPAAPGAAPCDTAGDEAAALVCHAGTCRLPARSPAQLREALGYAPA